MEAGYYSSGLWPLEGTVTTVTDIFKFVFSPCSPLKKYSSNQPDIATTAYQARRIRST